MSEQKPDNDNKPKYAWEPNDERAAIELFQTHATQHGYEIFIPLHETDRGDIRGAIHGKNPARAETFRFDNWRAARKGLYGALMMDLAHQRLANLKTLDRAKVDLEAASGAIKYLDELMEAFKAIAAPLESEADNGEN